MLYTLPLNPAIDKTAVIPGLTPGRVNRIASVREDVGGKGVNVSKCLQILGIQSTVCAFWAGSAGEQAQQALRALGLPLLSVQAEGQTRTNLKIIDPDAHCNTDLNEPGPDIGPEALEQMTERLAQAVQPGDLLILSGSVPRSVPASCYASLIRRFSARGTRVFLDADGEPFRLGVEAGPGFIKPNREELEQYLGRELPSEGDILRACRGLQALGVGEILVSLGAEGALYVTQHEALRADGLRVCVRSTVGAGDSMVAAIACGLARGLDAAERLRLAVSISAASVMCAGSEPPAMQTVRELMPRVTIRPADRAV